MLEYSIIIKNVLDIYRISPEQLEGGIVSSVVPQITMVAKMAAEKIVKKEILPGIRTYLDALTARAAQLQGIDLEPPRKLIGKNTIDCMKSGVIYGNAACVDGVIARMKEELGEDATVVATGGLAKCIIPYCREKIILDDDLLLKGLLVIYRKNR